MDSLNPASPVAVPPAIPDPQRPPRIWKFWGTALWGLFIFAGMFVGQVAVIAYFVLRQGGPIDMAEAIHVVGGGLTISLSVIMGLPAVLLAVWIAIRPTRTPFADYLALRWTSWQQLPDRCRSAGRAGRRLGPAVARARARGDAGLHGRGAEIGAGRRRAVAAGGRVLRRRADVGRIFSRAASSIAAGRNRSCGVAGAIVLSSLAWTSLHLQYDWFFFGEIFSIGLLLGYLALPHQLDLADHRPARPQQSGRDDPDILAGGHNCRVLEVHSHSRRSCRRRSAMSKLEDGNSRSRCRAPDVGLHGNGICRLIAYATYTLTAGLLSFHPAMPDGPKNVVF